MMTCDGSFFQSGDLVVLEFEIQQQRCRTDCSICCAAMALRRSYEEILAVAGDSLGWDGAKFDEVFDHFGFDMLPQPRFFRPREPAILSVPSRTTEGGYHAVYYEWGKIFDPTRWATPYELASALTQSVTFYQWRNEEVV